MHTIVYMLADGHGLTTPLREADFEKIPTEEDGIRPSIHPTSPRVSMRFNANGQRVGIGYRGLLIEEGRKLLIKGK